MPDRSLDLYNKNAVADFITMAVDFLPAKDRSPYLALLSDLQASRHVPLPTITQTVKDLAVMSWPARRALDRYVATVGADLEWDNLIKETRATTATHLKRLKKSLPEATLDEALSSADADILLDETNKTDIEIVRPHVRASLWQNDHQALQPFVKDAQVEFEALQKRLHHLGRLTQQSSAPLDLLPKFEHFEDRILFAGEAIPLEILDAEIQFDESDTEVPPNEEPML